MRRVSVDIGGTFTDCFVAWAMITSIESKGLTRNNGAPALHHARAISLGAIA